MKKEYRRKSLKYKMFFLLMIMALIFDITLSGVSYIAYTQNMNEESHRICSGVSETLASDININHMRSWINGKKTNEYERTEEKLINLMQSFKDLKSIKIYKMNPNEMQIIYNIERDTMKNSGFDSSLPYGDSFSEIQDDLIRGDYIDTIFSKGTVTSFTPIKESTDKALCYVICEISTQEMLANREMFIKTLFITVGIVAVMLMIIANIYMNAILISPINRIERKVRKFAENNSLGEETIEKIEKIKHHNVDEIVRLRDSFVDLISDVSIKRNEVKDFDNNIMERMRAIISEDEIVTPDDKNYSLTNK